MILFFISLLAGVLTVLAPCTISLLPVIVGGSIGGGQSIRRALTVTLSLGVSVILFTLLLKVSTAFIHVPQTFWQILSGVVISSIGLSMLFPALYEMLPGMSSVSRSSNKLIATGYKKQSVLGDILIGAALGPVFSSCSPTYFLILATVLPRSLLSGVVYLLAYAVGLCVSLLVVTIVGQKLLGVLGVAADPRGFLKRTIGVLFVLLGLAIVFGLDKKAELAFASSGIFDITQVEQHLLAATAKHPAVPTTPDFVPLGSLPGVATSTGSVATPVESDAGMRVAAKQRAYQRAPEITNPSGFLNTPDGQAITLAQFRGKKVVLVDFWTYSCINCQRTLPYVKAWNDKYASQGLEIVSIHTPEFGFEKVKQNVADAAKRFGITYPIVQDNDYGTWNAFGNQFWPRKYLIDIDGFIVYDHAGEGEYDVTEKAIQKALAERAALLGAGAVSAGTVAPTGMPSDTPSRVGSPETYFGSSRNEYLASGRSGASGTQTMTVPPQTSANRLYLGGTWDFVSEYAHSTTPDARIVYSYNAKNVYFVASATAGVKVRVLLDGKPIGSHAGSDVAADGTLTIHENRLYSVVAGSDSSAHTLELQVLAPGLDAYTFTFG